MGLEATPGMTGSQDRRLGYLSLRTLAMPADANPNGDIFGGWLMAQMDIAGGMYAYHVAQGRVVTVAVEAMSFHKPVYVGDQLSCYCNTLRRGNTSLQVLVETWVRRRGGDEEKVTDGTFTYVAVSETGTPRVLPPQAPQEETF